jgi:dipeptidyl aminopeptidase/acylaminoacyl peptidase
MGRNIPAKKFPYTQVMKQFSVIAMVISCCAPWSLPLAAQAFQDLSTTEDGSVLYFASPIRQKGTNQSFNSKIYRWDAASGVRVVAEVADPGESNGCTTANFYQLHRPQVSRDGSVLAYTGTRQGGPAGGSITHYCLATEPNQGVIQTPARTLKLDGTVAISPNGRYAITTPLAAVIDNFHVVTDLTSGVSTAVAGAFDGAAKHVTDEGTTIKKEQSAVILTDRTGGTRIVQTKFDVHDVIIDHSGSILVYVTSFSPTAPGRISIIDLTTGRETQVTGGFSPSNPSLTSDGSTLLFSDYSDGPQIFAMGIDRSNPHAITFGKNLVSDFVFSGNGLVAFAVTTDSRLTRLDVRSGVVTELASATPMVTAAYRAYRETTVAAVGSVIQLYGPGMASVQQVSFCGRQIAIAAGSGKFQVPWDLPDGVCQAIVASGSPFEHAFNLEVKQYDPSFVLGDSLLVHQNFKGLITQSSPAHSGEEMVTYMTGLGPVDGSGIVKPGFHCGFNGVPADVLYAGLAPQFVGFYQVNIRVPDLRTGSAFLNCGWDQSTQAYASVWVGF